jgi:hypothetical protein
VLRDVTTDFVDRTRALARFRRMLAGETDKRILLLLEREEGGKSYFLRRLFYECEEQSVPVVLIDFDQDRSGLLDYVGVARTVRRYLGDRRVPTICRCEDAIAHPGPLVQVQTGAGDAGVDFGRRGRFADAEIAETTGRDHVNVSVGHVTGGHPSPAQEAHHRAAMGRALRDDVAGLAEAHRHVVVLVDTFEELLEEACATTCRWLEHWLFDSLRDAWPHVLLVVAGRPPCQAFFSQPHPSWKRLIDPVVFTPIGDQDILTHFRKRGLTVSEQETSLLQIARLSPARMAALGDLLEQAQGSVG